MTACDSRVTPNRDNLSLSRPDPTPFPGIFKFLTPRILRLLLVFFSGIILLPLACCPLNKTYEGRYSDIFGGGGAYFPLAVGNMWVYEGSTIIGTEQTAHRDTISIVNKRLIEGCQTYLVLPFPASDTPWTDTTYYTIVDQVLIQLTHRLGTYEFYAWDSDVVLPEALLTNAGAGYVYAYPEHFITLEEHRIIARGLTLTIAGETYEDCVEVTSVYYTSSFDRDSLVVHAYYSFAVGRLWREAKQYTDGNVTLVLQDSLVAKILH